MKSTRTNRGWAAVMVAAISMMLAATIAAPSQTLMTLHSFDGRDGNTPLATLVQAIDGNLYGTTSGGGANGDEGSISKITLSGTVTALYSFCLQTGCADGANPYGDLVQAIDGTFYGTTYGGGRKGYGTVFTVSPSGTLTTLYSFCSQAGCADGQYPGAGLIQAIDGNFYGTTYSGGTSGDGTVFRISPSGSLATLYSFCSQSGCTDGANPYGKLVQAPDGYFYGTSQYGGAHGVGTLFKLTPSGAPTTLHSFNWTDGAYPYPGLVLATNGDFYGTTFDGGTTGYGTVFKMTPSGSLTTLYSFCIQIGCGDGANPTAALVQATDSSFYGTTYQGGNGACELGCGTVFKISPNGTLTPLHSFGGSDGAYPFAALVQDTNGTFYGTTSGGGANNLGTVFSLFVGLGPFVETQPTFGKAGKTINILGTNLTRASSVTFNGTPATFIVELPTGIKATVPTGATTGPVQVLTPSGTLTSNVNFQVQP